MIPARVAIPTLISALASGCTSMSGLDAETNFACKAPKGVSCASITAVHANANSGTLPALQSGGADRTKGPATVDLPALTAQASVRSAATTYATPSPLATAAAAAPGVTPNTSPSTMNAPTSGTPIRTPERILRVWVAPFEDTDGDFHDQRYVYVTVNRGQWTVERARAAIRNQYQLVRPLSKEKEPSENSQSQPQLPAVPNVAPLTQ